MTGPLLHFMPVIAGALHRPIIGDPYFDDVSLLTEFHGRPPGTTGAATEEMNIVRDKSGHNIPLFIVGQPFRYALDGDLWSPAPKGVSDVAAYYADQNIGASSAIVVGPTSEIELSDKGFSIHMRVRGTRQEAATFAGRWKSGGGGYSWTLNWYPAMKYIRFQISTDGAVVEISEVAYFRLGSTNDGVTVAEFFNDQWHDIDVARIGNAIIISIDGHDGYGTIDLTKTDAPTIYDPLPENARLHIGSVAADMTGLRTSTGNWKGFIKQFTMVVDGDTKLDVDFSEYFTMWWAGNYPYSMLSQTFSTTSAEIQDSNGIIKDPTHAGTYFPFHESMNLNTGDFTVEVYGVKANFKQNTNQHLIGMGWGIAQKVWRLVLLNSGGTGTPGMLAFQYSLDGASVISVPVITGLADGAAISGDFAVSVFSGTIRVYRNGTMLAEASIAGNLFSGAPNSIRTSLYTNANQTDPAQPGTRILAIRITKGVGRYRGPFYRVPPLPLPKFAP